MGGAGRAQPMQGTLGRTGSVLPTAPALYAGAPTRLGLGPSPPSPQGGGEASWRCPSDRLQPPHRRAVAGKQAFAIAVAAALNHMRAAADDVGDGGVVGREDPRIEDNVAAGRRERGMLAVEHGDEVGALSGLENPFTG